MGEIHQLLECPAVIKYADHPYAVRRSLADQFQKEEAAMVGMADELDFSSQGYAYNSA